MTATISAVATVLLLIDVVLGRLLYRTTRDVSGLAERVARLEGKKELT